MTTLTDLPATQTQVTPAEVTVKRGTIRTRLLAVPILSCVFITGIMITYALTSQRASDTALIMESVGQQTFNFSERIFDLENASGQTLSDPELRANVLSKAEALIDHGRLPLTNVAVIDTSGAVLVGYSSKFSAGTASTDMKTTERWAKADPALTAALKQVAHKTTTNLRFAKDGYIGTVKVGHKPVTVAASIIPGNEGVTVVTVDGSYVRQRIVRSLLPFVLLALLAMLLSVAVTAMIVTGVIRRLIAVTQGLEGVANNQLDTPVPVTGNDEITTLGESGEKVRLTTDYAMSWMTRATMTLARHKISIDETGGE